MKRQGNRIPPQTPNFLKIGTGGTEQGEVISYTADKSEMVPVEVKQFYEVPGEYKEDMTNHIMTVIKQMITESKRCKT